MANSAAAAAEATQALTAMSSSSTSNAYPDLNLAAPPPTVPTATSTSASQPLAAPAPTTTRPLSSSKPAGAAAPKPTTAQPVSADDLSLAVDDLLEQVRGRYSDVSKDLLGKMDEMSRRLDELETSMRAQ